MTRSLFLAVVFGAGISFAAAPRTEFTVVNSADDKVCDYFRTHHDVAPIKWTSLLASSDGDENFRASFDFENTGKQAEVRRREDRSYVFGGTYFLVAPMGFAVPTDWFEQLDMSKGFAQPPAPMRVYVQEDMNTTAEIAQFNKRNYVRTNPIREDINFVMI